jgi:hypothetical protein
MEYQLADYQLIKRLSKIMLAVFIFQEQEDFTVG